jgi:hypothetical protein
MVTLGSVSCAWGAGLVACAVASGAACLDFQGHSCGGVNPICNKTTVTLASPNDAWTPGMYTLALTADGTQGQCTVTISDPPPLNGVGALCPLDGTFTLELVTVDSCPPVVCNANACEGMSCTQFPVTFR